MATLDQITALIRAHADGNAEFFKQISLQIAANHAAKSPSFSRTVQQLVDRSPCATFIKLPNESDKFLTGTHSTTKLSDMVLAPGLQLDVDRVLEEHRQADKLREHGLQPARKLLFVGPPGTGKTMLSSALANALGLPILKVQLHTTIASHLGETAAHLGKIFDSIKLFTGVYLFDEFDALAGRRDGGDRGDLGEMRRVTNSLLGFMEQDQSHSVIIAATNHDALVDSAMFRRFDQVIYFPLPDDDVAEQLIRTTLLWWEGVDFVRVRDAASGIGHADLVAACLRVSKDALLAGRERIETNTLVRAIMERAQSTQASRATVDIVS